MKIAICILAKNERATIGRMLEMIASQTLVRSPEREVSVFVVANGCTDDTARAARDFEAFLASCGIRLEVMDLPQGGKSRSWNKTIHEFISADTENAFFVDSDVILMRDTVLEELDQELAAHQETEVVSGHPIKDIAVKDPKTLLDRFSLSVSKKGRYEGAINGSLYLARMKALRDVWLPDETPGEDGFLNAMVSTRGFSQAFDPRLVRTLREPTHLFQAHGATAFHSHERRMIVATMINRWVFEHLWSLKVKEPAGPLIARWNEEQPHWVDELVAQRTKGQLWTVSSEILVGRLGRKANTTVVQWLAHLPAGLIATLLTLPPAIAANKRLKQAGAAATW